MLLFKMEELVWIMIMIMLIKRYLNEGLYNFSKYISYRFDNKDPIILATVVEQYSSSSEQTEINIYVLDILIVMLVYIKIQFTFFFQYVVNIHIKYTHVLKNSLKIIMSI